MPTGLLKQREVDEKRARKKRLKARKEEAKRRLEAPTSCTAYIRTPNKPLAVVMREKRPISFGVNPFLPESHVLFQGWGQEGSLFQSRSPAFSFGRIWA